MIALGFLISVRINYRICHLEQMLTNPKDNGTLSFAVLQVVAGLVIATLPIIIERFMPYRFPEILYAVYLIFVYCSILLGTGLHFYSRLYYWDKFLHVLSAGLLAGLGYTVFNVLISKQLRQTISALLMSLFAATFGSTIGVLWEFYEFTGDRFVRLKHATLHGKRSPLVRASSARRYDGRFARRCIRIMFNRHYRLFLY